MSIKGRIFGTVVGADHLRYTRPCAHYIDGNQDIARHKWRRSVQFGHGWPAHGRRVNGCDIDARHSRRIRSDRHGTHHPRRLSRG